MTGFSFIQRILGFAAGRPRCQSAGWPGNIKQFEADEAIAGEPFMAGRSPSANAL